MNPLGIIAIVIAVIAGFYALSAFDIPIAPFSRGPLATGPGFGVEVANPEPTPGDGFFGDREASEAPKRKPGESPYKDKVHIASVTRSGEGVDEEYLVIRYGGGFAGFGSGSRTEKPVDVTYWRIASARSSAAIPRAYIIPEVDGAERNIILPPGGELIVLTGTPSYQRNFQENQCIGYLNEFHRFTPSLSNSCPDDNPNRSDLIRRGFNGACIDAIDNISVCRTPEGPFEAGIIRSECIDFMNKTFSYAGCVEGFRGKPGFLRDTWRVALRRNGKLYDPRHDRIELRDAQGLLVDEFEY